MACVRKRRNRWTADWRDGAGIRQWKTFETKCEAEDWIDRERPKARQRLTPTVPATSTMAVYAEHWQAMIASTVKPRTLARYRDLLRLHLLPHFGKVRIRDLKRDSVKKFLTAKLQSGLDRDTVRNIYTVLRALLYAAIDSEIISANPAARLGKSMKLVESPTDRQEEIKAMTQAQRQLFLATAYREAPRYYPLFFVLAGTGMRLGESLALQPNDLDCSAKTIEIARAFSEDGSLGTPKNGKKRTVEISQALADTLAMHEITWKQEKLTCGWAELPLWLFVTKEGTPIDPANVRRSMQSLLKKAKLPLHFTPHCLRHTYASILLAEGVPAPFVQEQLGHMTIELTVSTYGKWLKKKAPGALDRLDPGTEYQVNYVAASSRGSKMVEVVANSEGTRKGAHVQPPEIPWKKMEPAIRIERTTCGLRNRCLAF